MHVAFLFFGEKGWTDIGPVHRKLPEAGVNGTLRNLHSIHDESGGIHSDFHERQQEAFRKAASYGRKSPLGWEGPPPFSLCP